MAQKKNKQVGLHCLRIFPYLTNPLSHPHVYTLLFISSTSVYEISNIDITASECFPLGSCRRGATGSVSQRRFSFIWRYKLSGLSLDQREPLFWWVAFCFRVIALGVVRAYWNGMVWFGMV